MKNTHKKGMHGKDRHAHGDKHRKDTHSDAKEKAARSNPKIEYSLIDATAEEKALVLEGTIVDRVNCLTLLCARNPSADNYKQLLFFAENQRNDVIYLVLKNLRDLLKERIVEDCYIKGRILKSFERGVKNQYIKEKVIEIAGVLVRSGVYEEELLTLLTERLGEKDKALRLVHAGIKASFLKHGEFLMQGIEDFYYKNDNFRAQHSVLKFLAEVEFGGSGAAFGFYDQGLAALDAEYHANQRDLMLDLLINGLSRTAVPGSTITEIDLVRSYVGSAKTAISSMRLLKKIGDPFFETFVLRATKSALLRGTRHECALLNIVSEGVSRELLVKLLNSCFFFSPEYIVSLTMIASEQLESPALLFGLMLLARHYHPLVRSSAMRLLRREKVPCYDPYDRVVFEGMAAIE